jgi:type I restriction enzyme S subunit
MTESAPSTLGKYIQVKHGFAFKGEHFTEHATPDVLVTPGNFAIGGGFQGEKLKYYAGPVPEEYVLEPGALVVTMTDLSKAGDTLGYPALIPDTPGRRYLHNQRIGLVETTAEAEADKRFLFYRLCAGDYRHHVLATASGSTVRHTSPGRICDFETTLPPIQEQRAIAGILGALDDKIEQNGRTSRALERLSRAIFRAWFVDFEPVKAKAAGATAFPSMPQAVFDALPTRFVDSEIGPVPKGWEPTTVSTAFDVNPPRPLRRNEVAPYLDMKNMPTEGHAPVTWMERPFASGMRFMNGDTLLARITPCLENGKTAFVDFLEGERIAWGSTEYIVLRPKPPLPAIFAYCLARTGEFRDFAIQNMIGTSGRQRVAPNAMDHFRIAMPSEQVAVAFGEIAQPLFNCIRAGMDESRTLAEMRDFLLPKLLSGSVRVGTGHG